MQSLLTRFPRTQQWRIYCQKYRFKELKIFYLPDLSLPLPLLIHISKEVRFWVEVEWPEGGGWEGGKWKKDDYTRSEGREGYLVRGKEVMVWRRDERNVKAG